MRIIWTPSADADRDRIWLFNAEHNVPKADRIEVRLNERAASLASLPRQGRPIRADERQLSLPDIQLVIRYRIVEDEGAIRILRVWHTRENREAI